MNRRGFFGLMAGALVAPFVPAPVNPCAEVVLPEANDGMRWFSADYHACEVRVWQCILDERTSMLAAKMDNSPLKVVLNDVQYGVTGEEFRRRGYVVQKLRRLP